jgi:hypothetical protein
VRRDGVPIGTEWNFLTTKLGSIPERGGEILAAEEAMEIEEVRKEVEELYRELVRRKYERAIKKGASEQALANFIALHEKFLPAFVEKEMKWIEIIEEEEKREGDCHLRRWPEGAKRLIKKNKLLRGCYKL